MLEPSATDGNRFDNSLGGFFIWWWKMEYLEKLEIKDLVALKSHISELHTFHKENFNSSEQQYRSAIAEMKHIGKELEKVEILFKKKRIDFRKNKISHYRYSNEITSLGMIKNKEELEKYFDYLKFILNLIEDVHKENVDYKRGQRFLEQTYHETLLKIIWIINSKIYEKDTYEKLKEADQFHRQSFPRSIDEIQVIDSERSHQEICYRVITTIKKTCVGLKWREILPRAKKIILEEFGLSLNEENIKQLYYNEFHKRNPHLKKKVKEVKEK